MKIEYFVLRVLVSYDKEGDRTVYALRGRADKFRDLENWVEKSYDELLDALGEEGWELTAGTTALTATVTDIHLVLRRSRAD